MAAPQPDPPLGSVPFGVPSLHVGVTRNSLDDDKVVVRSRPGSHPGSTTPGS
jgi:hypothetical protein